MDHFQNSTLVRNDTEIESRQHFQPIQPIQPLMILGGGKADKRGAKERKGKN
jgi:hypothetical protein